MCSQERTERHGAIILRSCDCAQRIARCNSELCGFIPALIDATDMSTNEVKLRMSRNQTKPQSQKKQRADILRIIPWKLSTLISDS